MMDLQTAIETSRTQSEYWVIFKNPPVRYSKYWQQHYYRLAKYAKANDGRMYIDKWEGEERLRVHSTRS